MDKEGYDSCRVGQGARRIVSCDRPGEQVLYTISFRSFSLTGGLSFSPGMDYHLISTSSPEDIEQVTQKSNGSKKNRKSFSNVFQLYGGMCHTHNMKVTFKVRSQSDLEEERRRAEEERRRAEEEEERRRRKEGKRKHRRKNKKRKRKKEHSSAGEDDSLLMPNSASSPKPYDFYLNQAKSGLGDKVEKKKDNSTLVKQEASTSNGSRIQAASVCCAMLGAALLSSRML